MSNVIHYNGQKPSGFTNSSFEGMTYPKTAPDDCVATKSKDFGDGDGDVARRGDRQGEGAA